MAMTEYETKSLEELKKIKKLLKGLYFKEEEALLSLNKSDSSE